MIPHNPSIKPPMLPLLLLALFFTISAARQPLFPTILTRQSNGTGLTFDPCKKVGDCAGVRRCLDLTDFPRAKLCTGDPDCLCLPAVTTRCTTSASCGEGEVCARTASSPAAICVSAAFEAQSRTYNKLRANETAPARTPPPTGLTYDFCQQPSVCQGNRECIFASSTGETSLCNKRDPCICLPVTGLRPCSSNAPGQCQAGEVCALSSSFTGANCVSATTVNALRTSFVPIRATSSPPPPNSGLTLDPCKETTDCQSGRNCMLVPIEEGTTGVSCPALSFTVCKCYPVSVSPCQNNTACVAGEICRVEARTGAKICISKRALEDQPSLAGSGKGSPTPSVRPTVPGGNPAIPNPSVLPQQTGEATTAGDSPSEEPSPSGDDSGNQEGSAAVCIDAKALDHLDRKDLVFDQHAIANVLCDASGSCATRGHIVMFQGKAMMMQRYCDIVECVTREMEVNSPRYRRRLVVKSKTAGLVYTAFAARYETGAEELALKLAVKAGL